MSAVHTTILRQDFFCYLQIGIRFAKKLNLTNLPKFLDQPGPNFLKAMSSIDTVDVISRCYNSCYYHPCFRVRNEREIEVLNITPIRVAAGQRHAGLQTLKNDFSKEDTKIVRLWLALIN